MPSDLGHSLLARSALEMVAPTVTPAHGVARYACDHTQGPACALAAPAATVFRNYLVYGGQGQHTTQIDTLKDVGDLFGNDPTSSHPRYENNNAKTTLKRKEIVRAECGECKMDTVSRSREV